MYILVRFEKKKGEKSIHPRLDRFSLRIPVYSIINNSRRDLSIHLNSIDFTLVQISSHV